MIICTLTASRDHGGASISAFEIARGMAKKGHRVHIISAGLAQENYLHEGIRIEIIGQKYRNPFFHYFNPFLLWKLKTVFNNIKPDIIHVHNINLQSFSLFSLLYSRRYPMVWTLHDVWPLCVTGWPNPPDCIHMKEKCRNCPTWPSAMVRLNKFVKETVFRLSKMSIVCPSNWMARMLQCSILKDQSVYTAYNGIDINLFHPPAEEDQKIKPKALNKKKFLLFCGGKKLAGQLPAERKGWQYLVSSLRLLKSKDTEIELLYLGDPIKLPADFPIPVNFVEGVDREEMCKYYNIADLFILPTLADNFPLTILEAMACKTPIISTDVGGIPEIIIPNETGILCPPRNAAALAEKIDYALSNPDNCSEMAEKAYQRFIDMFAFDRMVDQYENVYIKTIADRAK